MIKILLVEDEAMIASGLIYALEQESYQVIHGETVAQVKEIISGNNNDQNESDFDLAILDMQLPDGTGFDVAELLDRNRTKFIFLTVVDDEGNVVRAFETGADDYITKPFRLRELLARIKRSLSQVPIGKGNELYGNESKSIGDLTIGKFGKLKTGSFIIINTPVGMKLFNKVKNDFDKIFEITLTDIISKNPCFNGIKKLNA